MKHRILSVIIMLSLCLSTITAGSLAVMDGAGLSVSAENSENDGGTRVTYHANYPKNTVTAKSSVAVDNNPVEVAVASSILSDSTFSDGPSYDGADVEEDLDDVSIIPSFTAKTVEEAGFFANGYTFVGWSDREDATFARYRGGDELRTVLNQELYAVWVETAAAAATYTVTYHAGNGRGNTTVKQTGDTVTLYNSSNISAFSPPADFTDSLLVGWSLDPNVVNSKPGAEGDSYAYVDYFDSENAPKDLKETVTLTLTEDIDLYAVYGYPHMKGYALSITSAKFTDDATTQYGQKLVYYADTAGGARKYYVASGGYPSSTADTGTMITVPNPISTDATQLFVGWYDKNATGDNSPKMFSNRGDTVLFAANSNFYSHDAMWATLYELPDITRAYDTDTHALGELTVYIDGLGGTPEDTDDTKNSEVRMYQFWNAMTPSFSLTITDKNGNVVSYIDDINDKLEDIEVEVTVTTVEGAADGKLESLTYSVKFHNLKDALGNAMDIGQVTAGEYTYVMTPILINESRDDKPEHELNDITGKLTITPANLTIEKEVTVTAHAGQQVTVDFGYGNSAANGVYVVDVSDLLGDDVLNLDYFKTLTITAPNTAGQTATGEYSINIPAPRSGTGFDSNSGIKSLDITNDEYSAIIDRRDCYNIIVNLKVTVQAQATELAKLTIVESGAKSNESFLYKVTSSDGTELIVSVKGGGSTTIEVPFGTYTVTEISDWSWRYDNIGIAGDEPDDWTIVIGEKKASTTFDDDEEKIVTYSHVKNDKAWLGGEYYDDNHFASL